MPPKEKKKQKEIGRTSNNSQSKWDSEPLDGQATESENGAQDDRDAPTNRNWLERHGIKNSTPTRLSHEIRSCLRHRILSQTPVRGSGSGQPRVFHVSAIGLTEIRFLLNMTLQISWVVRNQCIEVSRLMHASHTAAESNICDHIDSHVTLAVRRNGMDRVLHRLNTIMTGTCLTD